MAAIEFEEWVKGKRSYYVEKYGILLTENEKDILREIWNAARDTMEKSRTSTNKQRAQCPNLWHDGLHDGCGICPDCGEAF